MTNQPPQVAAPPRLALCRLLLHIRPAPVAALLKRLIGIQRHVITTPIGRLSVDPASDFGYHLLAGQAYKPELTAAFRALLKPGDTCVDIGAHEGWFSILAAQLTGESGRVLAVEPQDRLRTVLNANFALNGLTSIRIDPMAISDRPGEASLFLAPDTRPGASRLSALTPFPCQTVRTCTLGELLDRHALDRITLLKMDIEGHEHEAILGSPGVFTSGRVRHLALEIHPTLLNRRGRHPGALMAFLEEAGYAPNPAFPGRLYSRIDS